MKLIRKIIFVTGLFLASTSLVQAAPTQGSVTFNVQVTQDGGRYAPRHVDAIWVTTASGAFVKTLRKDGNGFSGEGTGKLYKFNAIRGGSTVIDGYTGSTISTYNPITITWNCRDLSNAVVPDGDYKFWVEFTEANAQGPYTTNGIQWTKGTTTYSNTYPNETYIKNMKVVFTPTLIPHDVGIVSISPRYAMPNSTVTVNVGVTNLSTVSESVNLVLSNLTAGARIAMLTNLPMAANTKSNYSLAWGNSGLPLGNYTLQATATVSNDNNMVNNTLSSEIIIRNPTHDLAIALSSTPPIILPNTASNIVVTVSNTGDFAESFPVTLFNETDGRQIASSQVSNLAAQASTKVTLIWLASDVSNGYKTVRATVGPAVNEDSIADNTVLFTTAIAPGLQTITLVATNALWRYNDFGFDLSTTPWLDMNYYDGFWRSSQAPFGFNNIIISTQPDYGPNSATKYLTYYFRHSFPVNLTPVSATLRLRRDDGAVIYLNNRELLRDNMPSGSISFTNRAASAVGGGNNYTNYSINPALLTPGLNQLAVEVHLATPSSFSMVFAMELLTAVPNLGAVVHDVAVMRLEPAGAALGGDRLPISIALTNRGNMAETFSVYVVNSNLNQVIASTLITNLPPSTSYTFDLDWDTLGVAPSNYTLQAFTVVNGVTNSAGISSALATISSTGIELTPLMVSGSIGGACSAVAAQGNIVLAGAGATLVSLDASNSTTLTPRSSLRMPGIIEGISITGSNVFVACGNGGVQFVTVDSLGALKRVNSYTMAGHAYSAKAFGNYLFIAAGRAGLRVVDISNPGTPILVGAYATEGPACALAFTGSSVCLLDQHLGVSLLDVSNPAMPTLLGAFKFDAGVDLAVSGNLVYTLDRYGNLRILSLEVPETPALVNSFILTNIVCRNLAVFGTTVYVAADSLGLVTLDAANLPFITATNATGESIVGLSISENKLYAANSYAGIQVYSLTTPTMPVMSTSLPLSTRGADTVLKNGLAFVAAGESGLKIFSITNTAAPQLIGVLSGIDNARSIAVDGSFAYVGEGQFGFKVVGVSNPANPNLVGVYINTNLGCARNLAVSGGKVLVSDGTRITLVDAGNPANPATLASFEVPGFALGLAVLGSTAYVAAGSGGVLALNFGDGNLTLTGTYRTPGVASSIAVQNNRAYVADSAAGWLVLDISNPGAISLVSASAQQGAVSVIAVSTNLVHLSGGPGDVQIMDVSTPLTPVPVQRLGPLVNAMKLATDGKIVIAAEGEAGLAILDTTSTNLNNDLNNDGLPDDWEQQIVNASQATNGPIRSITDVKPGDDFDRDGLSNYQEYIAGTSPVDAQSVFAVQASADAGTSPALISWKSVAGKTYSILQSTNLKNGFTVLQENIAATPPMNIYTNHSVAGTAFYMISVK